MFTHTKLTDHFYRCKSFLELNNNYINAKLFLFAQRFIGLYFQLGEIENYGTMIVQRIKTDT